MEKKAPGKKKNAQMNSVIRAIRLLEILQNASDNEHTLSQKEILEAMVKVDARCTEKTIRTDLHNLMKALNSDRDDNGTYRIRYDGIEEGRHRISGVSYVHEFSNDELELIISLLRSSSDLSTKQVNHLEERIRILGSSFYTYHTAAIIPQHSTIEKEYLKQNMRLIDDAITKNKRISFLFNAYDKEGHLRPVRSKRYLVNPYYVVIYGMKYYLLCTVAEYKNVQIYRLDLMTDMVVTDVERNNIRYIPELQHSNATEYMMRHPNMNFDEPMTIQLKISKASGYTAIHDMFGTNFKLKREIDEQYDEIEVVGSENAIIDLAIQRPKQIEIIRPSYVRKHLLQRVSELMDIYQS